MLDLLRADPKFTYATYSVDLLWKPVEVLMTRNDKAKARKLMQSKECDIYAVGVIFYEILTRCWPGGVHSASVENIESTFQSDLCS